MHDMQPSIGFASNLVPLVMSGSKTITYRLGIKYDAWSAGLEVMTYDSDTRKPFAVLKIVKKISTQFKDLPINRPGHEVYSSKEEMRNIFKKYYGNVQDTDYVVVLEFQVVTLV